MRILASLAFALSSSAPLPHAGEGQPGIYEVRGQWKLTASRAVEPQTVLIPLPLEYQAQVPLSFELRAEPAKTITSAKVRVDTLENHVAEISLAALDEGDVVELSWISVVLVGPREFEVPKSAPIPSEWPAEARLWLAASAYVQSTDERIIAVAREMRAKSDDVLDIVSKVLEKTRRVYDAQEGRCNDLGAIQALERQGSCTSCANLVAALLRANGIPARILAGYPTWCGALQTHYIVEAWVPGFGWYPLESTLLKAPWDPTEQIQVAVVPVEHENRAGARSFAGAGVPYLSLTEYPDSMGGLSFAGTIKGGMNCDHIAELREGYAGKSPEWPELLDRARERWKRWLDSPRVRKGSARLATPLASDDFARAKDPKDLANILGR